jgi:hypothetical protein
MDSIDLGRADGTLSFIGKMSEVSWIARAHSYLVSSVDQEKLNLPHATQFSYYMDEENILSVDEDYVDACYWPGDEIAQILFEAYFHALQGIFNCIDREKFLLELFEYRNNKGPMTWDSRRWLALANLAWAIGSKWLSQAKLNDDLGLENHLVYYARARALGLDHRVMLDHPGMQGVRALGMLSFYLFTNGSVTRYVGRSVRKRNADLDIVRGHWWDWLSGAPRVSVSISESLMPVYTRLRLKKELACGTQSTASKSLCQRS